MRLMTSPSTYASRRFICPSLRRRAREAWRADARQELADRGMRSLLPQGIELPEADPEKGGELRARDGVRQAVADAKDADLAAALRAVERARWLLRARCLRLEDLLR